MTRYHAYLILWFLSTLALIVIAVASVYLAVDIHSLVTDLRSPFEAPWINVVR